MPPVLELVGVPAVSMLVALAAAWLIRRYAPADFTERSALAIALVASFITGYLLLHGPWVIVPVKHSQWPPYLAILAALATVLLPARAAWPLRLVVYVVVALPAAWLLVPSWDDLIPPRHYAIPLLAAYLLALAALLAALPDRLLGWHVPGLLAASATTVSLLTAIEVSLLVGHDGAVAAAGLAGCCLSLVLPGPAGHPGEKSTAEVPRIVRGLVPVYAVLVGGLAFDGAIEPSPPMPIILAAPAAPLALWLFAASPLARLQGKSGVAAQIAAVLLPLALALAWVAIGGVAEEGG